MKKTLFLIASISFTCSMHGQMAPQESEWYTPPENCTGHSTKSSSLRRNHPLQREVGITRIYHCSNEWDPCIEQF